MPAGLFADDPVAAGERPRARQLGGPQPRAGGLPTRGEPRRLFPQASARTAGGISAPNTKEADEDNPAEMLNTSDPEGWWSPTPTSGDLSLSYLGPTSGDSSSSYWGKGGKPGPDGSHRATSRSWEPFDHSTSKIPPFWEPTLELRGYPFRVWLQDLDVWAAGIEVN